MKHIIKYILLFMTIILLTGCELFGESHPKVTINYNCEGVRDYNCQILDNKLNCMFILPECENKYFAGWYTEENGGDKVNLDADFSENTVIYAHWSNEKILASNNIARQAKYIVSFNTNDGLGGQTNNIEVKYNEEMPSIKQDAPTRSGYTFMGWYDNSNYLKGKQYYTEKLTSARKYDVEKNITLYAGWKSESSNQVAFSTESNVLLKYDIKYDVSFNLNGGTGAIPQNVAVAYDKDMPTITASIPTRSGYTFMGWYDNANYSKGTQYYKNTQKSARKYKAKKSITLYAGWKENTYTISFNLNGGSGGQSKSKNVKYNNDLPTISKTKPQKKGYTFIGWYDAVDGGNEYYNSNCVAIRNYMVTNDITLYARWKQGVITVTPTVIKPQYTISFNLNGGTGTQDNINAVYDEKMPTLNGKIPTRSGYTFMGWYDNSDYTKGTQYYNEKNESIKTYKKTSSITLYAGWKANTYTISFDSNGGKGGQAVSKTVTYGQGLPNIDKNKPVYDDAVFIGWYDSKTGGNEYYNASLEAVRCYDVDKNITLYARWKSYTISFNTNGGNEAKIKTVQAIYSLLVPKLSISIPSKKGHAFMGWYDNADYTKGIQYYDNKNNSKAVYLVDNNIILYAGWEKKEYTISFNVNGGDEKNSNTVKVKYNEKLPEIDKKIPSRDAYLFMGWYDNTDYTKGKAYYNSNCDGMQAYDKAADTTLYAGWSKVIVSSKYKITYDYNYSGGPKQIDADVIYGNKLPSINEKIPSRSGYEFMGWYDNKEYSKGIQYYSNKNIPVRKYDKNYDTTLYAGWKIIIEAECHGSYQNGYGLARLDVNVTAGKINKYVFKLDGREVQNGISSSYVSKNWYELLINPTVEIIDNDGQKHNLTCNISHSSYPTYNINGYYFHVKGSKDDTDKILNPYPSNALSYYLYVPSNIKPDEKLPLIIGLHGGYGWGVTCNGSKTSEKNQTHHYLKSALYHRKEKINNDSNADPRAIILTPSNMTCGWEGSISKAFNIIYAYIKLYNIDINNIIITGSSQGGYGTLYAGFLEEQVIHRVNNDNTTLESVAAMYGTTAEEIITYNQLIGRNIQYDKKKLSNGQSLIVRPKNSDDQRSIFSLLVPMSPAKNLTRCAFTPTTIYDVGGGCKKTPPYDIKTPIWVITSNDEYDNIQKFAKELTAYYSSKGNIRYTVLTNLKKIKIDAHKTQNAIFGKTSALDWMIKQRYDEIDVQNDKELSAIEKSLGSNFAGVWKP